MTRDIKNVSVISRRITKGLIDSEINGVYNTMLAFSKGKRKISNFYIINIS